MSGIFFFDEFSMQIISISVFLVSFKSCWLHHFFLSKSSIDSLNELSMKNLLAFSLLLTIHIVEHDQITVISGINDNPLASHSLHHTNSFKKSLFQWWLTSHFANSQFLLSSINGSRIIWWLLAWSQQGTYSWLRRQEDDDKTVRIEVSTLNTDYRMSLEPTLW